MSVTNEERKQLVSLALEARQRAYAPYSNYPVGAALMTKSKRIYTGCNIENASYPLTICGERAAMFNAVSQGSTDFDTIVIATRNGGSPCGACRQVMAEFSLDMKVIIVDQDGAVTMETTVAELLPAAFTPENLR